MRIKIVGECREPKCFDCFSIDIDSRGVATVTLKAPTFHEWWENLPRIYQIIVTDAFPKYKMTINSGRYSDIDPDDMSAMQEIPKGFYAIYDMKAWSILFRLVPLDVWHLIEAIADSPFKFMEKNITEDFPDKYRKEIWSIIQVCRKAGYYLDNYVS